jgi:hypothetical protein
MTFHVGQVVKLNDDGLRWVRSTRQSPRTEWAGRTAVIKVLYRDDLRAQVIWKGNKTLSDGVPLKFLESVGEQKWYGQGNPKCKISPVKRQELVDLWVAGGAKAVRAKAAEYGVSARYAQNAAVNMGLKRGPPRTRLDSRWAKARAIGAIVA